MREFYVDFLGFDIIWQHRFGDDAPLYVELRQENCVLHLSEHHGDATPGSRMRIEMDDVTAYQQKLAAKLYKNARPGLKNPSYGGTEMSVTDPFGNTLTFWTAS